MERQLFEKMYADQAPWDIGRPQQAVIDLAGGGMIRGSVLDVGCGTGDNALWLAAQGHETWGLDYVPVAIERAQRKAAERKLDVHFELGNALELATLGRQFDTALDCGLFHTFSDDERPTFVRGLAAVVRPGGRVHILCFSDQEPGSEGPRRVTQQEIRYAFAHAWRVERIVPTRFEVAASAAAMFSPGGPKAWLATIERTAN
ncbi:MAG TPA: class I SAM-dependent methyltransferase [Pirellulales bacterium]|nr:class I SAM-dependent methyltransferase [Pirellulales bacterium]